MGYLDKRKNLRHGSSIKYFKSYQVDQGYR